MLWGEFILCIAFQSRVFASYYHTLGCRIFIWTKSCKSLIHWRTNFINILGPKCFLLGTFGSEIFSCAYFVSPKLFVVGTLWVKNFFSWVVRGPKSFYCGYFVGPKDFIVGTLWVVGT